VDFTEFRTADSTVVRFESAQARWRAVNGAHLVPIVRAGARFGRGLLVERAQAVAA